MAEINSSTCSVWLNAGNSSICFNFASYLITTSFGINMILSLPLHCFILWLSVKEMIRGQSTEIFVFNASLVEVIFCSDFVFVLRMYLFKCADCKSPVVLLGVVLFVGRPLFLTCICVERYLGVLHPLIFLKLKPMKYRIACSAVGWIVIICSCLICDMYVVHYKFILPVFLVFFSVTLYTCLMVLKALMHPGERDAVHQDKLKAFQIIRLVLVSTSLTYVPGIASLVLYYILKYETFAVVWSAFLCFGIMTGFVQPVLYLRKLGKLSFFTMKRRVTFNSMNINT